MEFRSITEFRTQAENCFNRSELTSDTASKLHWLTLAEAWLLLADNIGKREVYETCGVSIYQYSMQRPDTRH